MKQNLKLLLTLFILIFSINSHSQSVKSDEKTKALTVEGRGKTKEDAKYNALKKVINQSDTKIISSTKSVGTEQEVSKLATVKSCVIEGYSILSEEQLSDGSFVSTLNVWVSNNELIYIVNDLSICTNNFVIVFKNNQDAINYAKYLTN